MKKFLVVRPEVQRFAQMMERTLRKHDAERGEGVEGLDADFCIGRIQGEFKELMEVWKRYELTFRPKEVDQLSGRLKAEAVDVANFCMMLCLS